MTEISNEYAAALFMLSLEENKARGYFEELSGVSEIFSESPDYQELLSSPAIAVSERLSAIEGAFSGKYSEHIVSFLMLLCEKGRIRYFADILGEYERLLCEYERTVEAVVTSAMPLSGEEITALRTKLEKLLGHKVEITNVQDKSIIGGLIIEADGKVIDGSIRGKLAEVKEVISK